MSDVFISYRRLLSTSLAQRIKVELLKAGINPFLDVDNLQESGLLSTRLQEEVRAAPVFLSLLGTNGTVTTLDSEWVLAEIRFAHDSDKKRIPVLQEGFNPPHDHPDIAVQTLLGHMGTRILDLTNHQYDGSLSEIVTRVKHALRDSRLASSALVQPRIKVLIVDDESSWHRLIEDALQPLSADLDITFTDSFEEATAALEGARFELCIVDLRLEDDIDNMDGLRIAEQWRALADSRRGAFILLTGVATPGATVDVMGKDGHVHFKQPWDANAFRTQVVLSLRERTIERQREQAYTRNRFVFTFARTLDGIVLTSGDFMAASGSQEQPGLGQTTFRTADYERIVRQLTQDESDGAATFASDRDTYGMALYQQLLTEAKINGNFSRALEQDATGKELSVIMRGELETLDIPFELLVKDLHPLVSEFSLIRQISGVATRNVQPYYEFLRENGYKISMLIVTPEARDAERLSMINRRAAALLGIQLNITPITGAAATAQSIRSALHNEPFHLVHLEGFAQAQYPPLSLNELSTHLNTHKKLRLLVLNDFLGTDLYPSALDRLLRAEIPSLLTYQFPVHDMYRAAFADTVYSQLWHTLDIAQAVFHARRSVSNYSTQSTSLADNAPVLIYQR